MTIEDDNVAILKAKRKKEWQQHRESLPCLAEVVVGVAHRRDRDHRLVKRVQPVEPRDAIAERARHRDDGDEREREFDLTDE